MGGGRRAFYVIAIHAAVAGLLGSLLGCAGSMKPIVEPQETAPPSLNRQPNLPPPSALARHALASDLLVRLGSEYEESDPRFVLHAAKDGSDVELTPAWNSGHGAADLACAVYTFQRADQPLAIGLVTTWDTLPAAGELWVGFADVERDTWCWQPSQPAEPLTSLAAATDAQGYIAQDGRVVCAIVLLGHTSHRLQLLDLGASAPQLASVSPTAGAPGSQVTFQAEVTGSSPLTFNWDFGDGAEPSISQAVAPTVTLGGTGQFPASLTVSNPLGSDQLEFNLEIAPAGHVVITGLSTDKVTHCVSGDWDQESGLIIPSHLTLTCINSTGAVFTWARSAGLVTGDGLSVTWQPAGDLDPGSVTVSVTADNDISQDTASIHLRLTEAPIEWSRGDPDHPGRFIDFSNLNLLEPLSAGGKVISAPGRPLSYFCDGSHVVLLACCALAEPLCLSQLPQYHNWVAAYQSCGLYAVLDWPDDSLSQVRNYLESPSPPYDSVRPLGRFNCYFGRPSEDYWTRLGYLNTLPYLVLIDVDGFIRLSQRGEVADFQKWERVLQQLTAAPPYNP